MTSLNAGDATATLEKFDVCEIVNETLKRYEPTVREKGLKLNVHMPENELPIVSDRAKIERIFKNIFNNAVKFTAAGEINLKVTAAADRTGVDLQLTDTGVGIEEDKMASIFEPFHQADTSSQRNFAGLGLGLTVAHRMSKLIGAKLTLTSKANVGTEVLVRLPSQAVSTTPLHVEQRKYG